MLRLPDTMRKFQLFINLVFIKKDKFDTAVP